ncbi:hypothetical protein C8F01DRAFT_1112209 [Mycena amicta]|nr:hypothetical protein C8F01DRAFT_1112209 [Mycena amicta]
MQLAAGRQQRKHLLDLPPEIILSCLLHLSLDDLASCLRVHNRLLGRILTDSLVIRYRAEQELAGVHENPKRLEGMSTSDRLAALKGRQGRWCSFDTQSRYTIPLPSSNMSLYDVTAGHWVRAETENEDDALSTKLSYLDLSPDAQPAEWQVVCTSTPFVNFSTALEEHDLLVMITCAPCVDDPSMATIDAQILSLSTGTAHPLAAHPTIHLRRMRLDVANDLDAGLEISGRILAIACLDWDEENLAESNLLYILDWQSGLLIAEPFYTSSTAMVFITPTVLAVPQPIDNTIEIYQLPSNSAAELELLNIEAVPFNLPPVKPGFLVVPPTVQLRISPTPRTSASHAGYLRAPFIPLPEEAVILLCYDTFDPEADDNIGAMIETHLFVIRAATLLDLFVNGPWNTSHVVPWSAWGPKCTRWLDPAVNCSANVWISGASGQRVLSYPPHSQDELSQRHRIRVLDFNPRQLAHLRRQARSESPLNEDASRPEVEDEEVQVLTRIVEAGVPNAVVQQRSFRHFAEPVASDIAYVETISKATYDFHNIYLSEECIIGIRHGAEGSSTETLEVLHFG